MKVPSYRAVKYYDDRGHAWWRVESRVNGFANILRDGLNQATALDLVNRLYIQRDKVLGVASRLGLVNPTPSQA